jgi:hypothetical protein
MVKVCFGHMQAGDIVPKKKPDPAIYLLAAKELGVDPANCCVVEDSHIGLKVHLLCVYSLVQLRVCGSACVMCERDLANVIITALLDSCVFLSKYWLSALCFPHSAGRFCLMHSNLPLPFLTPLTQAAKAAGMVCLVTKSSYTQDEDFR